MHMHAGRQGEGKGFTDSESAQGEREEVEPLSLVAFFEIEDSRVRFEPQGHRKLQFRLQTPERACEERERRSSLLRDREFDSRTWEIEESERDSEHF